jgi:formylglycine-generating enzyme required for sulfatase activity
MAVGASLVLGSILGGCLLLVPTDSLSTGDHPSPAAEGGASPEGSAPAPTGTDTVTPPPPTTPGRSCAGLPKTCGPKADQDCCANTLVPGGSFSRDSDATGSTDPSFRATVSAFRLDTYEVTVGRFHAFINAYEKPAAGSGKNPNNPADTGWNVSWNATMPADRDALISAITLCQGSPFPPSNPADATLPVGCVSWYEAFAFCIWDGGRLPTDAESNFAAVGGDEQRVYPWSSPPTSSIVDHTYASYDGDSLKPVGFASPKGDSRWGAADMLGNVWEWVLDYNADNGLPHECKDCANLTSSSDRASRGCSITSYAQDLHINAQNSDPPDSRHVEVGIRCARQP